MSDDLRLGQLIEDGRQAERDATHIAVVPVVAGEDLHPGWYVQLDAAGRAVSAAGGIGIGIVDPFLSVMVEKYQRFWLWLTPGSITSLRHDWTHPAFPAEPAPPSAPVQAKVTGRPSPVRWRTPTVQGIIQQMRDTEDYTGAPVLADALDEAGYDDEGVLAVLRRTKDSYRYEGEHTQAILQALDDIEDDGGAAFSEQWLRRYAIKQNSYDTPETAFNRLVDGLKDGALFFHGSDLHGLYELDDADELRRHGERYLGVRIDWEGFSFSCSC